MKLRQQQTIPAFGREEFKNSLFRFINFKTCS
jgi:hypothetical protein